MNRPTDSDEQAARAQRAARLHDLIDDVVLRSRADGNHRRDVENEPEQGASPRQQTDRAARDAAEQHEATQSDDGC